VSTLAEDNLSDDSDEGIGGTFIGGIFDSLSEEVLLRNDGKEGFLDSVSSVSLLFICRIALSGLLLGLFDAADLCRGEGVTSGEILSSVPSTEGGLDKTGGGAATGSETIDLGRFLTGEAFRDFASFLASLGAGEGDLDDVFHDLLAKFRKVLETERPVDGFDFSVTPAGPGFFMSFNVEPPRSSAESVNLVTAIFPFPLLDALRSSSLLGTYGECPSLGDLSGERARTLSEKVRLMPSVGCDSLTPGRCV
jgi:hypothetical protein